MAVESAESKSIKELTKMIQEREAEALAVLKEMAAGPQIKIANQQAAAQLKALQDTEETQKEILGVNKYGFFDKPSEKDFDQLPILAEAAREQKKIMEAQKTELEKLGLKAEDQASYRKEQIKLAKIELKQARASGSKEAEIEAKKKLADLRQTTLLGKISGSLTGILDGTKDKIKGGLSGFKKFAFGALAVAALAFLNSPKFEEIKKTILDVIIPALAFIYDNVIVPLATYIGGKLKNLFIDLKAYVDGEKGLGSVIFDNIGIITGIIAVLSPKLLFGALQVGIFALKNAFFMLIKPLALLVAPFALIAAKIALGVALVTAVINGIVKGIDAFLQTGSAVEGIVTMLATTIGEIIGVPVRFFGKLVKMVGDFFGIKAISNFGEKMSQLDPTRFFLEVFQKAGDFVTTIIQTISDFVQGIIRKIPFKGNDIADALFGTKEEQEEKRKANEAAVAKFRAEQKTLKEKQDLEKAQEKKTKEEKKVAEAPPIPGLMPAGGNPGRGALPRARTGIGPVPAQREATPPPAIVNAPTTVNSPSTTNVSQNATSLAPTDRVLDQLSVAI